MMRRDGCLLFAMLVGLGGVSCDGCADGPGDRWDVRASDADVESMEAGDAGDTGAADVAEADVADGLPGADRDGEELDGDTGCDPYDDMDTAGIDCPVQRADAFGDCGNTAGAVFDGTRCVDVSGCECDSGRCPAFDSVEECARQCGRAGECRAERM
ncbi:MAG: hypothetical protein ABEN55_06835, partial [Bradymonadaceae bacterium]